MTQDQLRAYIRHPSDIPITVQHAGPKPQLELQLNNVSLGGLSFSSPERLQKGTLVKVKIPGVKPAFSIKAVVQWCEASDDSFEVGVRFLDEQDAFKTRMVEQVCHINQYRKDMASQGVKLSKNKASMEWIAAHGANFPAQEQMLEKEDEA